MWFVDDLRSRLAGRIQLTSDGHKAYLEAVEGAFGGDIDYAILHKVYGASPENRRASTRQLNALELQKHRIEGDPDEKHVSTSYVERSNLTMRMHMRRFTRLTNGFSKKVENHAYAVALHMMYYNFVKLILSCACHQQWPLAFRQSFGRLATLSPLSKHRKPWQTGHAVLTRKKTPQWQFHFIQEPGRYMMCDFSGLKEPEMNKVRPVIVTSPRLPNRSEIVAVVPISLTAPAKEMPFVVRLSKNYHPMEQDDLPCWAKCDMLLNIGRFRLDGFKVGRRKWECPQVIGADLDAVRAGVLHALGLSDLKKMTQVGYIPLVPRSSGFKT